MRKADRLIAILLAAVAVAVYWLLDVPGVPPEAWHEAAVALGIRPPDTVIHGSARHLIALLGWAFGPSAALTGAAWAGHLAVGVVVGLAYLLLMRLLRFTVRAEFLLTKQRMLWLKGVAVFACVLFALTPPMRTLSETFTSDVAVVLLSFVAFNLVFWLMEDGGLRSMLAIGFVFGLLAADGPAGVIVPFLCAVLGVAAFKGLPGFVTRLPSFSIWENGKTQASVFFVIGFGLLMAASCTAFFRGGGPEAGGILCGVLPLQIIAEHVIAFRTAMSVLAFVASLVAAALPCAMALFSLRFVMWDTRRLTWKMGVGCLVGGLYSYLQLTAWPMLWWRTPLSAGLGSPSVVVAIVFVHALTLATVLYAGVGVFFVRDHARLARHFSGDESAMRASSALPPVMLTRWFRVLFAVAPFALIALALPLGGDVRRDALAAVEASVDEIAREAADVRRMFTDGWLDEGVELASECRGNRLSCISLFGAPEGYDRAVRLRAAEDRDERMDLAAGAASAFRNWTMYPETNRTSFACMLGFETWKSLGRSMPPCSGFIASSSFPTTCPPEKGAAAVRERIAPEVLRLLRSRSRARLNQAGPKLARMLFVSAWRMSRLARMRSEEFGRNGDEPRSQAELDLSTALDDANPLVAELAEIRRKAFVRIGRPSSPREILKASLRRADFAAAAAAAEMVLRFDPQDIDACFALAMHYFTTENNELAESYFRRCLKLDPREPAVLNNLAMTQMRLGRFDEAETNALKALNFLPRSAAVSNTLVEIRRRRRGK